MQIDARHLYWYTRAFRWDYRPIALPVAPQVASWSTLRTERLFNQLKHHGQIFSAPIEGQPLYGYGVLIDERGEKFLFWIAYLFHGNDWTQRNIKHSLGIFLPEQEASGLSPVSDWADKLLAGLDGYYQDIFKLDEDTARARDFKSESARRSIVNDLMLEQSAWQIDASWTNIGTIDLYKPPEKTAPPENNAPPPPEDKTILTLLQELLLWVWDGAKLSMGFAVYLYKQFIRLIRFIKAFMN